MWYYHRYYTLVYSIYGTIKVITEVLDGLTADTVNIIWSSRQFEQQCQLKEEWFGTPYSTAGVCVYTHSVFVLADSMYANSYRNTIVVVSVYVVCDILPQIYLCHGRRHGRVSHMMMCLVIEIIYVRSWNKHLIFCGAGPRVPEYLHLPLPNPFIGTPSLCLSHTSPSPSLYLSLPPPSYIHSNRFHHQTPATGAQ